MTLERSAIVIARGEGELVNLRGLGAQFKIEAAQTGGRFAIVEHPTNRGD
jgi:hypothetical protein